MSTGPGAMQLSRIPSGASSAASERVTYSSAALLIPYTHCVGRTSVPEDELIVTTRRATAHADSHEQRGLDQEEPAPAR